MPPSSSLLQRLLEQGSVIGLVLLKVISGWGSMMDRTRQDQPLTQQADRRGTLGDAPFCYGGRREREAPAVLERGDPGRIPCWLFPLERACRGGPDRLKMDAQPLILPPTDKVQCSTT
jgi:hypothetical protein